MDRSDIAMVAHDTILNFPKKIKKPFVQFLEKKRFSRHLDLLKAKKHVNLTPCFVASMKGGDVIFVCDEVVHDLTKKFSKDKKNLFIEAIILHELFHIWNNIQVRSKGDLIFSEALVHEELREMYPKHAKLLNSFAGHRKGH
jgi:hypothetical protein